MNKKIIIPLIFLTLLILIIIFCCIYTNNREKYYAENSEYFIESLGFAYSDNIQSVDDAWPVMSGNIYDGKITITIGWICEKKCNVSKFEYYLLMDYLNNVLNIYGKKEDIYKEKGKVEILYIGGYYSDSESLYCVERTFSGDSKTTFFVIILMLMFYIRTVYPYIFLIYFVTFLLLLIITKKYLKSKNKSFAELKTAVSMPLKFLIFSVIVLIAFEIVMGFRPIHWALMDKTVVDFMRKHKVSHWKRWVVRNPADLYVNVMYVYESIINAINFIDIRDATQAIGTNFSILIPITIIELLMLREMSKGDKRLYISYIIPSLALAAMHRYFFIRISSTELLEKFRDLLCFREVFPFHPKVFYFTLFFVIGLVLYSVFGLIINKNKYKSICWSFVFAVSNAGLVCMSTYVAQYAVRLL